MRFKHLISLLPFVSLAACSTFLTPEVTTSERGGHRGKTLSDVHAYVVRIASLPSERLIKENLEAITDTPLSHRGGYFDGDFEITHSLSIHLQLAQQSENDLKFFVEFRPMLPPPKVLSQENINDYMEKLGKHGPQVIRRNCISKGHLLDTLTKNGWRLFETNLSSPLEDEEGNFYLSAKGGRYITLTITDSCLAQFTISKGTKYPAYDGIPLPRK